MTTVLSYTFDGNSGGVPGNRTRSSTQGGSIVEEVNDLTITDTTGNSTGIKSQHDLRPGGRGLHDPRPSSTASMPTATPSSG